MPLGACGNESGRRGRMITLSPQAGGVGSPNPVAELTRSQVRPAPRAPILNRSGRAVAARPVHPRSTGVIGAADMTIRRTIRPIPLALAALGPPLLGRRLRSRRRRRLGRGNRGGADRARPGDPRPGHHPRHARRHQHRQLHRRTQLHDGPAHPGHAPEDGGGRARRGLVRRLHLPGSAQRGGIRDGLRERGRQVRRDPPARERVRARADRAGADLRRRAADRGFGEDGRDDRRGERLSARHRHRARRGVP